MTMWGLTLTSRNCKLRQDETLQAKADSLFWMGQVKLSKRQKFEDANVAGGHRIWGHRSFLKKMSEPPMANYRSFSVEQNINADRALLGLAVR